MTVFTDVKERVSLQDAVNYLHLGEPSHRKGQELRWACPACNSKDTRTLCVTLPDEGFGCWVGASGNKAKNKGDLIALVAHVRGITQTAAAKELQEHFLRSSTEPVRKTVPAKGRSESANALRPFELDHPVIELIGISAEYLGEIGGGFDGERILIPLPTAADGKVRTLGIATRADQVPLLLFSQHVAAVEKLQPDELRKLLRVV